MKYTLKCFSVIMALANHQLYTSDNDIEENDGSFPTYLSASQQRKEDARRTLEQYDDFLKNPCDSQYDDNRLCVIYCAASILFCNNPTFDDKLRSGHFLLTILSYPNLEEFSTEKIKLITSILKDLMRAGDKNEILEAHECMKAYPSDFDLAQKYIASGDPSDIKIGTILLKQCPDQPEYMVEDVETQKAAPQQASYEGEPIIWDQDPPSIEALIKLYTKQPDQVTTLQEPHENERKETSSCVSEFFGFC